LSERNLTLSAILLTHHHGDHVGGVADLLRRRSVPVSGPPMSVRLASRPGSPRGIGSPSRSWASR
jgi:glyoxylase-like metal-dependent hydrolase (beta-lactamase superfamily II)